MMNPAWPERIDFGQAGASLPKWLGKRTSDEAKSQRGFRPGTETGENVSRRFLRPRVHQRSTDHPVADPRPAGIRCPAGLDYIALQVKEVGSGASQRQLRKKLLEAARRREIDVVLVWRLDRWGRSVADLLATLQE